METTPVLRHVVLFAFHSNAARAEVAAIEEAFADLPAQIPVISALEWGTNVSPEGLAQGFTHCFTLTFGSAADRDTYLVHPAHRELGALLPPVLEKVLVIDYWTG